MNTELAIDTLVELREYLRATKEWKRADELRQKLAALGVTIRDTPDGAKWTYRAIDRKGNMC